MITEIRILPPLAFARVGSATEPQGNYELECDESSLGFRSIRPTVSLLIAEDGTLNRAAPGGVEHLFRDGPRIRPVAPFFELFAVVDEQKDLLQPLTIQMLEQEGLEKAITWKVEVENRKVTRRTGNFNDRVRASTPWFNCHTKQRLTGSCENCVGTIEFGHVQFVAPTKQITIEEHGVNGSQIRLRFTPATGTIYGPLSNDEGVPSSQPVSDGSYLRRIYKKEGEWTGFGDESTGRPLVGSFWSVDPGVTLAEDMDTLLSGRNRKRPGEKHPSGERSWPHETLPPSLYANVAGIPPWLNGNVAVSRGYLDDICDGFIYVSLNRPRQPPLLATARVCVGPPSFVPDCRFVRTIADDLDQVVNGPKADDLSASEARRRAMEIVRRGYEAVSYMNLAVMNGNPINRRPASEFDTMPAEESFTTERAIRPIISPHGADTETILALHKQVFASLTAGAAAWFPDLLRRPDEAGDLTDRGRRKMPALMSGADALYLALTWRQIDTIRKAAEAGAFNPLDPRAEGDGPSLELRPRNLSAQLAYRAAGNPFNSRPEAAVANCCPGLETDFRAVWRRMFKDIVLSEHENIIIEATGNKKSLEGGRLEVIELETLESKQLPTHLLSSFANFAELAKYSSVADNGEYRILAVVEMDGIKRKVELKFTDFNELKRSSDLKNSAEPVQLFKDIVLDKFDFQIIEASGDNEGLKGGRLETVEIISPKGQNEKFFLTGVIKGPSPADPDLSVRVLWSSNQEGRWTIEWSNGFGKFLDRLRRCRTERNDKHIKVKGVVCKNGKQTRIELEVQDFFEPGTGVISKELAEPGELTWGLCSPWQNDLRECACFYWASSRPDFVNTTSGQDGMTQGDYWLARERTGQYVPDDYSDTRLISYDEIFEHWEKLQIQIGGRDSAPDLRFPAPRRRPPR
jgi:hypothetical protein